MSIFPKQIEIFNRLFLSEIKQQNYPEIKVVFENLSGTV